MVGCAGRALSDDETDADAEGGSAGRSSMEGGAPATGGADGSGETGGTDSPGGVGSDVPRCVPGQSTACACADGRNGSQTCADDGRYESCVCLEGTLDWFRTQIVGEWAGTRTTPWDQELSVTLEFREDGTWTGACVGDDECPVFYYGSAREASQNTYRFTSVNDDRVAFGRIRLTWNPTDFTEGDLRDVRFESNETVLLFDFWATWSGEYGPVSFELERQE